MNKIIEINNLQKSYSDIKAVNNISFYVEEASLFAFLGTNGAGKSTTINILCTLLKPDMGEVKINNYIITKDDVIRHNIGLVFQEGLLDDFLTIEENLLCRGAFYGLKAKELKNRVTEVAELTGINELLKRKYGKLSGGQKRRCDIARGLINTPKILFLDEPTTGLDPQTRKSIWELIKKLQKENNMTVFFSSHYMEEATAADYVVVIDKGNIVAKGTPSELKDIYSKDKLKITSKELNKACNILIDQNYSYTLVADTIIIELLTTVEAINIIDMLRPLIKSFEVIKGSMDDAFISIVGKGLN